MGTTATPTGVEATAPAGVRSVAALFAVTRSIHRSESGTHTCASVFPPVRSLSATLYESSAVTETATHRPSEVIPLSRPRCAAAVSAGAMSGEATSFSRTGWSRQDEPKESSPLLTAPAVPPAAVRTRTAAMAVVRRRARGRGSLAPAPY